MRPPQLVVFDLGGTTVHDRGEVPAAFAAALGAAGIAGDVAEISAWRGASKGEVLERIVAARLPAAAAGAREALVSRAQRLFQDALRERLRAAPGLARPEAAPTFERLKQVGVRVALNTGFDRATLAVVLDTVAWPPGLLDAVVCSEDVPAGRPAPFMIFRSMELTGVADVRRVAVVGDTRLDLEAGANAGVAYRVGVLGGAHDRATLERAPYTHIVPSIAAVPDLWPAGAC